MSRLYEALKEASRIRQGPRDGDGKGLWEAWGISPIDIPPVQAAPEALSPAPADAQTAGAVDVASPEGESGATVAVQSELGASAAVNLDQKARLLPHTADAGVIERYRRLRTRILQLREEKPFKTLLVTSASPREGKTVTVLNLGLSLAMLPSFKVLVVDGDMRKGSLGNWLGVPPTQKGLSNLVDGSAKLEEVVLKSESVPMHFMVRGNSRVTDVYSSQFDVHLQKVAEHFDLVIVDSPPANLLADVQLLASGCDAIMLVARSFVTSRQALEKAVQDLQQFRVIGTVLNAGAIHEPRGYYGYY